MNNGFGQDAEIYSVTELNRAAKSLLEGQFPAVFVEGETLIFLAPHRGTGISRSKMMPASYAPLCSGIAIQGLTSRRPTA